MYDMWQDGFHSGVTGVVIHVVVVATIVSYTCSSKCMIT